MQFSAKQIAPPKEWGIFEDLCHALFKLVWRHPLAQKNGRRGQAQHGVDIYGSLNGETGFYQAVQCKGKDRNYGGEVKWPEVLKEIEKAEKFSPKLDHWILATTAPTNAVIQRAARQISVERKEKGQFTVDVLGWEEIVALMDQEPGVIERFYPEHSDSSRVVTEALKVLPSIESKVASIDQKLDEGSSDRSNTRGSKVWEVVTFESDRGLGPALLGQSLGPSDATSCPRLIEVGIILAQLKIAFSARLVGEPGAGKSICSYQAARELAHAGFEVLSLIDPQTNNVSMEAEFPSKNRLFLIDDAHLLPPLILGRIESQAGPTRLVLSTHNAVERVSFRGAITLDANRAVQTIAAALRSDLTNTLRAVRIADNRVGERLSDVDLEERLDHAENAADRPWQFCFVLGGGWLRSKGAADSARFASFDLVLAAAAMRQLISRDARATSGEIAEICDHAGIDASTATRGLKWLQGQRLIISTVDCRTPHQRFATVVLNDILTGQNKDSRRKIAAMIGHVLCDPRFPYAGLRALAHELHFGNARQLWQHFLDQAKLGIAVERCWTSEGPDRGYSALALLDLWTFVDGGATAVVGSNVATLAHWISHPGDDAYGFGRLMNDLSQRDRAVAQKVLVAADPAAIASNYSNASPETAYGLASLSNGVACVRVEDFNTEFRAALDRDKLIEFAKHEAFLEKPHAFSEFCASVVWWDIDLALDMAEAFIPTAQVILAKNAVEGFQSLFHELASTVLRVFDPLGVYVGKLKPSRRQWQIARCICQKIEPKRVAEYIASIRPRDLQSAGFFLYFLSRAAPRKFEGVLRKLDWEKFGSIIANDWIEMPHETEALLGALFSRPATRDLVKKFISDNAYRIELFPPRLVLMVPEAGVAHLRRGGLLRLAPYNNLSWIPGGLALAIIAAERPELVEQAVAPFVDQIGLKLTNYNRDQTGPAEGFIHVVIEYAPTAWGNVLANLNPATTWSSLAECLTMDEDHRRTAALVIESAITLSGPIGDMARQLRRQFPKASTAPSDDLRFSRGNRRSRQKRTR
jgi:hypothetical protein